MADDLSVPSSDIAVVIPLYNKAGHIARAIDSVLQQTCPPKEIIVVDDGSTDKGAERVARYSKDRVTLLPQTNQGVSVARNNGILHASTPYVCLLDADDSWHPDHVREILRLAQSFPAARLMSVGSELCDDDGCYERPAGVHRNYFGLIPDPISHYARNYGLINSSSACVCRGDWIHGFGFPEGKGVGEDIWTWLRLMERGPFAFSARALTTIHLDAENRSSSTASSQLPCHFEYYFAGNPDVHDRPSIGKFVVRNLYIVAASWRLYNQTLRYQKLLRLLRHAAPAHYWALMALRLVPAGSIRRLKTIRRRTHRP